MNVGKCQIVCKISGQVIIGEQGGFFIKGIRSIFFQLGDRQLMGECGDCEQAEKSEDQINADKF